MPKNEKDIILVVDDNKNNLDLMLVTLSDQNYRLLAATSGERALKIAQKVEPDLILMDIQMPSLDGYETARKMKEELNLVHVPILFLSALNDLNNIVQCFAAGGVDYISKPFKKEELLARVNTHLSIKHLQSSIVNERDRISTILNSILPKTIIKKLTDGESPKPEFIHDACVMFTDFVGFTGIVKERGATKAIEQLNHLFYVFDEITHHFGLERIKTIGDAYMAVAGVNSNPGNIELRSVLAALKFQEYMGAFRLAFNDDVWFLRIGLHGGPVIAGVAGYQKIAFDVWGNTVNISSRLEAVSDNDKITISETFKSRFNNEFIFGEGIVKYLHNWGNMTVYHVNGLNSIPSEFKELYAKFDVSAYLTSEQFTSKTLLDQLFDLQN